MQAVWVCQTNPFEHLSISATPGKCWQHVAPDFSLQEFLVSAGVPFKIRVSRDETTARMPIPPIPQSADWNFAGRSAMLR